VPDVYSFARQPKWIAGHLLAGALLLAFAFASVWQFSRHNERVEEGNTVRARATLQSLEADELFAEEPDDIQFRNANLDGTWLINDAVLIRNRSFDGNGGCHLVVPIGTRDRAVAVTVGWVGEVRCDLVSLEADLQALTASAVSGRVRLTQERGSIGPKDAANGRLPTFARVDVERIDQQVSADLAPVYVEAIELTPAPAIDVQTLEAPAADNGPHLGYAGQWLMFFLVGAVGYPLVLRRQAHKGQAEHIS
jgi:cytochrome oxidase assembly protein ShyY1